MPSWFSNFDLGLHLHPLQWETFLFCIWSICIFVQKILDKMNGTTKDAFYNQFKSCLNPYKTLNITQNSSPYFTFSINSQEVEALCDSLFGVKLNQKTCYLVHRLLYNFDTFTLIPFIHDGLVIVRLGCAYVN